MLCASSNATANCNFFKNERFPKTSVVLKLKFRAPQKTECNDWHQLQKKKEKKNPPPR